MVQKQLLMVQESGRGLGEWGTRRPEDKETRRRRDQGTRRQGDGEKKVIGEQPVNGKR
jgi:hypothetical protein